MNSFISNYGLDREAKKIKNEVITNISKVLDHNAYINGPENLELERKLGQILNAKYCVAVSSGTDALLISLIGIGLNEGDEVITTPFTFVSTIEVILSLKAKPILVDIDRDTFNIDAENVRKAITNKTKAIIPVSLFGQSANLKELKKIKKKFKNIKIIEDNAQSLMSKHYGKFSNQYVDISCTSFFPTKILGCFGDGGAIFLNNKKLAEKFKAIKSHGSINKKDYKIVGVSGRMDTIQSSIILTKLKYLNVSISNRLKIAKKYDLIIDKINFEAKKILISKPLISSFNKSVFSQYTIKTKHRNALKKYLHKHNISSSIYYEKLVNSYGFYKSKCHQKNLTIANQTIKQVLSIPINGYQTIKETNYICKTIYSFFKMLN